jgi:DNA-binding transcriptional LysR family regulator
MGRLVEEEARALLDRYDRLKEAVGAHERLERGTVRIGAGATAVVAILPDAIRAFRSDHPDVKIHVKEAGSRAVEADLLREEVEIGIVTLPAATKEVESRFLRDDPIVPVAAAGHPLARRRRVPVPALHGVPLIAFEGGSAIRRLIDRALERRGVAMPVAMELRSIQSMLRMVALDLGLAFVSRLGVDAKKSGVSVLDVEGLRIRRTLGVITKRGRGRPLGAAAREFLGRLA